MCSSDLRWIGHKAAVQNLADVAAMGARPVALVAALSAPASTPASTFEQLTIGLAHRAEADGARVVGGDLGRAPQLTVTVTAVGALEEDRPAVLRSGARPGDILAIGADRLGRSAAGLALVLSGRVLVDDSDPARPDVQLEKSRDPAAGELVAWHNAPDPELSLGWTAGRSAHAMMDLSDGLVRDGGRMAAASQVAVDLDEQALAPDAHALAPLAAELGADPWQWVLHGAEEHAMLAAFAPGQVPPGFRVIGRLRARQTGDTAVTLDGQTIPGAGFDHFS